MKILQIHFKNLNSLAGEWLIDLADEAFAAEGLFVITGPTGAGKSTILDAVCLALYGRTPRLGKITKSANEIMSRQTGESFAEVTFETSKGRFRSHWSQKRSRGKAGGELQNPKHEIANADSGEILESGIAAVARKTEELTGMEFAQFTRSILLAQGGFAAFLQAAGDDRAPILEQITGTAIYSDISRRVHALTRDANARLKELQAEISGISPLAVDEEKELEMEIARSESEKANLEKRAQLGSAAISWHKNIENLQIELNELAQQNLRLQADYLNFERDRLKLERSNCAEALLGQYNIYKSLKIQNESDSKNIKIVTANLINISFNCQKLENEIKIHEETINKHKYDLSNKYDEFKKIREIDSQIKILKNNYQSSEIYFKNTEKDFLSSQKEFAAVLEKEKISNKNIRTINEWLEKNGADAALAGELPVIEDKAQSLRARLAEYEAEKLGLENLERALLEKSGNFEKLQKQLELRTGRLKATAANAAKARELLDGFLNSRPLHEYRNDKKHLDLEYAYACQLETLEEKRAKLVKGEPCPLCGATEHPFAAADLPVSDEIKQKLEKLERFIESAEKQENAIAALEKAESLEKERLAVAEKNAQQARFAEESARGEFLLRSGIAKKLFGGISLQRQELEERFAAFGVALAGQDVEAACLALRSRLAAWRKWTGEKETVEKEAASIHAHVQEMAGTVRTLGDTLAAARENLGKARENLAGMLALRRETYGDRNPDEEEKFLQTEIARCELACGKVREKLKASERSLNTEKGKEEELKNRMEKNAPELARLEKEFLASLEASIFSDEKDFLAARLDHGQKKLLLDRAANLEELKTRLMARVEDREKRLNEEKAKNLSAKPLADLKAEYEAGMAEISRLAESVARMKYRLECNAADKARIREKMAGIEKQRKECERLDRLDALIGSSDGKLFRNFAQGLTFDIMIGHANVQLRKMTGRYLLLRDKSRPLELNVMDNYQAGEIRSTKNLSGGESFIVSLALALGLSRMASKSVRVDSLFLDEGFGTLDDDSLETALETLAGLRRDGKIIGVISHVRALKERISQRIEVRPQSGGRSRIFGPGCRGL